jgi:hypothetical protein
VRGRVGPDVVRRRRDDADVGGFWPRQIGLGKDQYHRERQENKPLGMVVRRSVRR